MWNCLWGHAIEISPEINGKSRVLYPGPVFLFGDTWPSMPKKRYNGLINQSINQNTFPRTNLGIMAEYNLISFLLTWSYIHHLS